MTDSGWLDEREARVWQAYREVMRDLQSAFDRQLADDAGLSGAEFALLAPLSESSGGVLRTRDLGLMVGWDRSRTSHLVSRMQKRGLVVREDCPDDARGSMVRLTPDGRAAIEAAAPEHVKTVRRLFFDPLSDEEVDLLGGIFERLRERISGDEERSNSRQ
ncbi:MarR family winged helix-turn-helix transcriptional regulator [Rhodococcus wratislaviensis]|uniref:Putative MarR family transcriptional regulator n=1 Tax=Rhodococcus wratislaviensis NBRC 100605 TaxID=1219028 RepID=X0Q4J9_RHOWR|nr:MarR family winged helix-turn-helix transcriptional regulator [Rhodococcus wratislaviensis]GAF45431.1 putative MarR family transcriptional regulator [Rhodococcus wratislaviensis NBRC 100605]